MNPTAGPESGSRPLSGFTVELDVYSGPYEWLLALILKDEVEIFEVPLKELIDLYLNSRDASEGSLERDAEFASSASSLVLLKSRTLLPLFDPESDEDEEVIPPDELALRLATYLRIRHGAQEISSAFTRNAGSYPTGHELIPKPGRSRIDRKRLDLVARRLFSRLEEPPVSHLGTITVTVQELAGIIRASLTSSRSVSFEELTRRMDRLHVAVAFAAALSLASEGELTLVQDEPLGPLTMTGNRIVNPDDNTDQNVSAAARVEAILFVSGRPVSRDDLVSATGILPSDLDDALGILAARYSAEESGLVIREVAGGFRLATKTQLSSVIEDYRGEARPSPLSSAALEVLSCILYLGPISRGGISRVRGVNSDAVVRGLVERGMISELYREPASPGSPALLGVAEEFFIASGSSSAEDFPALEDLVSGEELERVMERVASGGDSGDA